MCCKCTFKAPFLSVLHRNPSATSNHGVNMELPNYSFSGMRLVSFEGPYINFARFELEPNDLNLQSIPYEQMTLPQNLWHNVLSFMGSACTFAVWMRKDKMRWGRGGTPEIWAELWPNGDIASGSSNWCHIHCLCWNPHCFRFADSKGFRHELGHPAFFGADMRNASGAKTFRRILSLETFVVTSLARQAPVRWLGDWRHSVCYWMILNASLIHIWKDTANQEQKPSEPNTGPQGHHKS